VSAAPEAFALPADGAGRVAPESNPLGIQGTWTARAGAGSNVTLSFDGASVCFNGQAGQIRRHLGDGTVTLAEPVP
jgi:hypothetical protein